MTPVATHVVYFENSLKQVRPLMAVIPASLATKDKVKPLFLSKCFTNLSPCSDPQVVGHFTPLSISPFRKYPRDRKSHATCKGTSCHCLCQVFGKRRVNTRAIFWTRKSRRLSTAISCLLTVPCTRSTLVKNAFVDYAIPRLIGKLTAVALRLKPKLDKCAKVN